MTLYVEDRSPTKMFSLPKMKARAAGLASLVIMNIDFYIDPI